MPRVDPAGTAAATARSPVRRPSASPRRAARRRARRRPGVPAARSQHEHRVAEGVEAVPLVDRDPVEPARLLDARKGHHERQEGRARQVEVREQRVGAAKLEARPDEEIGAARQRCAAYERLEHTHCSRTDREDTRRAANACPRARAHLVALSVQPMLVEIVDGDRPEGVEPHVQRVVDDRERVTDHVRQVCEPPMIHPLGHAIVDQQARLIAARHGMLRNELRREVVLELPRFHPAPTVLFPDMDEGAIERAKERVEQRAEGAALDTLLARAREQVETLAAAASALEESLPARVGDAIREEAQPVARNLAEVRGLVNQLVRRLSDLENGTLTERNARVDDLALLVDLVSSGWKSVDARLARVEAVVGRLEQGLQDKGGAIVYRIEDRRPDAASS